LGADVNRSLELLSSRWTPERTDQWREARSVQPRRNFISLS
jgi:hypothetical protein